MKSAKKFFDNIVSAIYPRKCICCSEIIDNGYICDKCNKTLERNSLDDICLSCGLEKSDCVCKYNIYRFDSLVCVFKNNGNARKAYYSYKFLKKQHYSIFFANEMSKAVIKCYNNLKFDFICCVPSNNRFNFDHCGYLAKQMSKILNIPYQMYMLSCVKKTKKQHKSTIKERIGNVDGKYVCNAKIKNANVLLVDDIKTTGATLDECARMLLFAGAKNVCCVTALGSVGNKQIEKSEK